MRDIIQISVWWIGLMILQEFAVVVETMHRWKGRWKSGEEGIWGVGHYVGRRPVIIRSRKG